MNPVAITNLWIACLLAIGGLVLIEPHMGGANTLLDYARFVAPVVFLVSLCVYERISGLQIRNITATVFRRLLAIPLLILSMNWIAIFTLTDYRSHHRAIILPLSVVVLSAAMLLAHWRIYRIAEQADAMKRL